MKCTNSGFSTLLILSLSVSVTGCQSQPAQETSANTAPAEVKIPRKDWGKFDGYLRMEHDDRNFPSAFRVKRMNGEWLEGRVNDKRMKCEAKRCRLHPGEHIAEVDYVWSTSQTRGERSRKEVFEGLGFILSLFGGGGYTPGGAASADNRCKILLSFEAQSKRVYLFNVVHTVQQKQPDEFQIVDKNTGDIVASTSPDCRITHATALPFSDPSAPDDRCAVHIFMGKDQRGSMVLFDLNSRTSYEARHKKAYTVQVDPGENLFNAKFLKDTVATDFHCEASEAKFFHVDVEGIFTSELKVIEWTAEDAGPSIEKYGPKSR